MSRPIEAAQLRRWSVEMVNVNRTNAVRAAYKAGMTQEEIAEELGLKQSTVSRNWPKKALMTGTSETTETTETTETQEKQ